MSSEILKSINRIKISINENDQVLWECQASTKCYNQATTKLKEECERINTDIARIDEEIHELQPQLEILASCYEIQIENLVLNQESLVNQRLYKKCVIQNTKKHQEEVDRTVDEYSLHFQKCKEKLELTNPAYRTLQTKKTELKHSKIRCLDMKQKITELKKINKQKIEISQKLFYGDIIAFAKSWLTNEKCFNAMKCLYEEKRKEREYMQKLVEATELLKQKQKNRFCQKESSFKIPQIEFPKNDVRINVKVVSEKANKQFNNGFNDIKTLLEKEDLHVTHSMKNDNHKLGEENTKNIKFGGQNMSQKFEFNVSNSKVRILENRALKPHMEIEKLLPSQSKEERSRTIAAKLQKVVQNFSKSISRHNSNKSLTSSQKSILNNFDEKLSQNPYPIQENSATKIKPVQEIPNAQYERTEAPQQLQNLNITNMEKNNPETMFLSEECNNNFKQPSKNQFQGRSVPHLSQDTAFLKNHESSFIVKPQDNFVNKQCSQENKTLTKGSNTTHIDLLENIGKNIPSAESKTNKVNLSKYPDRQVSPFESTFGDKSKFTMSTSGFGGVFNMNAKNVVEDKKSVGRKVSFKKPDATGFVDKPHFIEEARTNIKHPVPDGTPFKKPIFGETNQFVMGDSRNNNDNLNNRINEHGENRRQTENVTTDNESYMKMSGMSSYNFGHDTQFSQMLNTTCEYDGYTSPQFDQSYISPEEDTTGVTFGPSNFADQPLFSFGQNAFSFK